MSNIKIKICGIKTSTILDYCNKLNVDYFGLVFYKKSPRNINIKEAKNLINIKKKNNTIPVGVFVNHNFNDLNELVFPSIYVNNISDNLEENKIFPNVEKIKFPI